MAERKLKDLRIGDKMWLYDFTDTTPITVVKKKREAELMTITLKYGDRKERVIQGLKRISKSGLRVYAKAEFNSLIIRRSLSKRMKKSVARHWK